MNRFTLLMFFGVVPCALAQSAVQSVPADSARAEEIRALKQELQRISARLDALENTGAASSNVTSASVGSASPSTTTTPAASGDNSAAPATTTAAEQPPVLTKDDAVTLGFFRGNNHQLRH